MHDWRNLGLLEVVEPGVAVRVEWVKRPGSYRGGDWTARIIARPGARASRARLQQPAAGVANVLPAGAQRARHLRGGHEGRAYGCTLYQLLYQFHRLGCTV